MDSYAEKLFSDRYAMAALSVKTMRQPELSLCAQYLYEQDVIRLAEKGKPLSSDHLKQLAAKWTP